MRANTDELADQILDIIERHIRLDPDDEGDPGEAAQRIISDIIAPIANGEDMTTIDHAAEARRIVAHTEGKELNRAAVMLAQAQTHAALALFEAQREANEIARIQVMLALPGTPEQMREAPVDEQGRERMERVLKGLGL